MSASVFFFKKSNYLLKSYMNANQLNQSRLWSVQQCTAL